MSATLSLTEQQIFTAVGNVLSTFGLVSATGAAIPIIQGQTNRTPEPQSPDYVVMWSLSRNRLAMNLDQTQDNIITGSIASNVLTVTDLQQGVVAVGQPLYGSGVVTGCVIRSQISGTPGGLGVYQLSTTPNRTSQTLYCGTLAAEQATEMTIQVDVHGPVSGDNAQRISTLFRDQFAVSAFLDTDLDVAPLFCTDPRQLPFINDQQQYENRWSIDLCMQINPTVTVTQQFADQLEATMKPVEVFFPVT